MIRETRPYALASGIALLLLLGTLPATAPASAEDDFRIWIEPVDIWVLEKDQDTKSSKFQEYRDLSSGLWTGLKLFGESADGGDRNFAIRLRGLGRDDGRYMLDYRLEGEYSLSVDYNKIPHRFGNDAGMTWDRPVLNRLEFPDPVQGVDTDQILAFVASGDRIDLGLRRDRTRARFDHGKMGKAAWSLEVTQENRTGDRPLGVAFGFGNVQEIPEPIDYDTRGVQIAGEINGRRSGLRLGYEYSRFENQFGEVIWDNPFNSVEEDRNPSRGRFDLAPDNKANLFFVDGRAKAGGWWFNGTAVYNTMTQDDPLLPYTINTGIEGEDFSGAPFPAASAGLPVTRANNEATTLTFAANAGTDLGADWHLTLRYRYYDYDNSSPRRRFPGYARLDDRWNDDRLITVPYDYTRDNVTVELGWDATSTTNLSLSYELESWDRTFREIRDSEEDILKLSLNSRPSDKATVRASWATGERTIGEYRTEAQLVFFLDPHDIDQLPGLRKYDQAVRDVDDYDVAVQLFPNDSWNFSFGLSGYNEDYPESEFGLVTDELGNYNFELGYTSGAGVNFFLFGHVEDRDVFQRARQSGSDGPSTDPEDTWTLALNEDTLTWGAGLNGEGGNGWSWDLSVNVSDTDGEADFETPPGGSPSEAVDISNYEDIELMAVRLKIGYELNERVKCGAFYLYEDYTIDSFILQGLQPFLAGTLLLVPNDGDYQANLFAVWAKFTM